MDFEWREDVIQRLTRIEALAIATNGSVKDHERRIRKLEYLAWGFGGAVALLTTALTIALLFLEIHR